MKKYQKIGMFLGIVGMLSIIIVITFNNKLGQGQNEIIKSKEFLNELYNNGLIDREAKGKLKIDKSNVNQRKDKKITRVVSKEYLIEIDSLNNLVGFASSVEADKKEILDENDAIKKAIHYLDVLSKDKYIFKEIDKKSIEDKKIPFYSMQFNRIINGYELYGQSVTININKYSGLLTGYVNSTNNIKIIEKEPVLEEDEGIKIVEEKMKKHFKDIKVIKKPNLSYNSKEGEAVLAYRIEAKGINDDGKIKKYIYIIDSNDGSIVNMFSNDIEKVKENH